MPRKGAIQTVSEYVRRRHRQTGHIIGHRQNHRSRPAADCHPHGLIEDILQGARLAEGDLPFAHRPEHSQLLHGLGRVAANAAVLPVTRHIRDDCQQRDG